jgi:hypothetical protein
MIQMFYTYGVEALMVLFIAVLGGVTLLTRN